MVTLTENWNGNVKGLLALIVTSDVPHVDEQLAAVWQHDAQRVDDSLGQVKLAEDLDIDDFRVGNQKSAQYAARVIGWKSRLGLSGVIRGRHATFDRLDLRP